MWASVDSVEQPVLRATRAGLVPAKEGVGKLAHRYKPVTAGTVFYNPMRILLGSIALVDEGDTPRIASPDYVAVRGRESVLHPVWFYYWFRSPAGAEFIKGLTCGAVRERLLFNRIAPGLIPVPPWPRQLATVAPVRAADKTRRAFTARLKVLEKLPAALLRKAFANDERASVHFEPPLAGLVARFAVCLLLISSCPKSVIFPAHPSLRRW